MHMFEQHPMVEAVIKVPHRKLNIRRTAGSVAAQEYARLIPMNPTCILAELFGSLHFFASPGMSAASENTVRRFSRGGVGATMGSSPAVLISIATRRA